MTSCDNLKQQKDKVATLCDAAVDELIPLTRGEPQQPNPKLNALFLNTVTVATVKLSQKLSAQCLVHSMQTVPCGFRMMDVRKWIIEVRFGDFFSFRFSKIRFYDLALS